jgi:hypothetical protein
MVIDGGREWLVVCGLWFVVMMMVMVMMVLIGGLVGW